MCMSWIILSSYISSTHHVWIFKTFCSMRCNSGQCILLILIHLFSWWIPIDCILSLYSQIVSQSYLMNNLGVSVQTKYFCFWWILLPSSHLSIWSIKWSWCVIICSKRIFKWISSSLHRTLIILRSITTFFYNIRRFFFNAILKIVPEFILCSIFNPLL